MAAQLFHDLEGVPDACRLSPEERARTIVVAGTNEGRREINRAVREDMGLAGRGQEHTLLIRRDTTQAERTFSKNYAVGDVIQPERYYPKVGLERGARYEVIETGPGNRLTVRGEDGKTLEFSPIAHRKLSVYRSERAELSVGDRVRITRNDAALDLANGDRFTVAHVSSRTITLTNGNRIVELPADGPLHSTTPTPPPSTAARGSPRTGSSSMPPPGAGRRPRTFSTSRSVVPSTRHASTPMIGRSCPTLSGASTRSMRHWTLNAGDQVQLLAACALSAWYADAGLAEGASDVGHWTLCEASMIFHASILLGVLAGAGAGTPPKLPSLAEASKRATLVVFGQVVRVEQGARPVATLEIEHVAKGEATGEISFFADKVGCCLPRATIGSRILAFLEPSGLDSPRFRFVGDRDASLDAFPHGETDYVAMTRMTGIQLPKSVCDPSVKHGLYDCTTRLDAVLAQARLKPAPVAGRKPATFRVVTRTCPPCELGDWLQRTAGPAAKDCGSAAAKAPSPEAIRCASVALSEERPFTVIVPMQGIDSDIDYAYAASADGTRFQFQYDSSVEGQGADVGGCAARVSRTACRALSVVESTTRKRWESWLSCDGAGQEEVLCAQTQSRIEVLDQERDVSLLRCDESEGEGRYDSCSILPASGDAGATTPPRERPSLVCYSPRPRGTVLAPSRPFPGETVGLWCRAR